MSYFKADLPKLMKALEIGDQPLPLIWTADFIPGPVVDGKDTFYVGEFNCSCVGNALLVSHISGLRVVLGKIECPLPCELRVAYVCMCILFEYVRVRNMIAIQALPSN